MWRLITASVALMMLCLSCGGLGTGDRTSPWPDDASLVVVDEIAELPLGFRVDGPRDLPPGARIDSNNMAPTISRVLLLPLVQNYYWKGKRHRLALADPLVIRPGERTIEETLSPLLRDDQYVRSCILIARGYCPGGFHPSFNLAGEYEGKTVWLTEMAKLPEQQFQTAAQIMIKELSGTTLCAFDKEGVFGVPFDEAIQMGKLLSLSWFVSPLPCSGDPAGRTRYVLLDVRAGTEISVCLSPGGLECVKAELLGPQKDTNNKE